MTTVAPPPLPPRSPVSPPRTAGSAASPPRTAGSAVEARVVARARFAELARLHTARRNDAQRLERSQEEGGEEPAEAVEECGLREDWRLVREDQCTTKLINEYAARRRHTGVFEMAAVALLCEQHRLGVASGRRPAPGAGLPWPLTVGVTRLIEQSRAHFAGPLAAAQAAAGRADAAPDAGAALLRAGAAVQAGGGRGGAVAGAMAGATAGSGGAAPGGALAGVGASVAALPTSPGTITAARAQAARERRRKEASALLGSLALAWRCRTVLLPQQRVQRSQRRHAAAVVTRRARLWLRLRRAARAWDGPHQPAATVARQAAAATMMQRCWRGWCGRQRAGWESRWSALRARRARRTEWQRSGRPGHRAASGIYDQLAVGAWHVAKEQHRIAKEKERERRVFEAAFKDWDKKMTRAVMMKPLHDDWVPQMGGGDGKPTSYYNVRTQIRVPYHPRAISHPSLPLLCPPSPSARAGWRADFGVELILESS